jgi:phosphatidylglycerophosphatase A
LGNVRLELASGFGVPADAGFHNDMTEAPRRPVTATDGSAGQSARLRPDLRLLLSSPSIFIALGGGAGLSPLVPGTVGSLLGIPLALALWGLPLGWQVAIMGALSLLGIWVCDRAGRMLGDADHRAIVWDEVCGMAIVLLVSPPTVAWIAASFVTFRVFDIVKPWPIYLFDRRLKNGFGVMTDDLLASGYAIVVLGIAQAFLDPGGSWLLGGG